jgi:nicotinamide mononucleotide adenylyltransferase
VPEPDVGVAPEPGIVVKRRAVVLACGSLSPPTYAHLRLLECGRDAAVERGYHVVAGVLSPVHGAYGKATLAPAADRIAMARLAVDEQGGEDAWVEVGSWEAEREEYSSSWEVAEWARRHVGGNAEVVFVCGGDMLSAMCDGSRWPAGNVRQLLQHAHVAVVPRPGFKGSAVLNDRVFEGLRDRVWFCDGVENGLSSSAVRECFAKGRSVRYLVPKTVEQYVRRRSLFGCGVVKAGANGSAARPAGAGAF